MFSPRARLSLVWKMNSFFLWGSLVFAVVSRNLEKILLGSISPTCQRQALQNVSLPREEARSGNGEGAAFARLLLRLIRLGRLGRRRRRRPLGIYCLCRRPRLRASLRGPEAHGL